MFKTLKTLLLGEPLKSELEGDSHALTKLQALAMLSSDALSSIAYGPEQVILVLIALSEGAIWWSLPIGIGVLVLLISLTISYSQIIHAYPNGGGAYMVSSDNLSPSMGLLAGGSLLIDYMLTVAVSVSSGADAITSAFPAFKDSNLEISIVLRPFYSSLHDAIRDVITPSCTLVTIISSLFTSWILLMTLSSTLEILYPLESTFKGE